MSGRRASGVRSEDQNSTLCCIYLAHLRTCYPVSLSTILFRREETRPKMAAAVGKSRRSQEFRQMCVGARSFSEGLADKPRLIPSLALHLRSPDGAKVQEKKTRPKTHGTTTDLPRILHSATQSPNSPANLVLLAGLPGERLTCR